MLVWRHWTPTLNLARGLPTFSEVLETQCVQVVKEIKALSNLALDEAAPLLALLQQNNLWPLAMKETISRAIHAKVQESMQLQHRGMKDRASLQDFTWFPVYLSESDWKSVLDDTLNLGQRCSVIHEPLEQAWIEVAKWGYLLYGDDSASDPRSNDFFRWSPATIQLLECEGIDEVSSEFSEGYWHSKLRAWDCLVQLPPTPATLDSALMRRAFGDNESPAPLPKSITMENLHRNMLLVPQRSNSKLLQLQIPKAPGPAAYMPMTMQMNWMAAQQMAAQQMAAQNFAAQQLVAQQMMSTPGIGNLAQPSTALALPSSSSQLALPASSVAPKKEVEVVPPRPETPSKKAALALTVHLKSVRTRRRRLQLELFLLPKSLSWRCLHETKTRRKRKQQNLKRKPKKLQKILMMTRSRRKGLKAWSLRQLQRPRQHQRKNRRPRSRHLLRNKGTFISCSKNTEAAGQCYVVALQRANHNAAAPEIEAWGMLELSRSSRMLWFVLDQAPLPHCLKSVSPVKQDCGEKTLADWFLWSIFSFYVKRLFEPLYILEYMIWIHVQTCKFVSFAALWAAYVDKQFLWIILREHAFEILRTYAFLISFRAQLLAL